MAQPTFEEVVEDFEFLDDWEDRYRMVIEMGKAMEPLPEALRVPATKVEGCASQVWLAFDEKGDRLAFRGDSDAAIVRGLVALMISLYSGRSAEEVRSLDAEARAAAERALRQRFGYIFSDYRPPPGTTLRCFVGDAVPTVRRLRVDAQGALHDQQHGPGDGTVLRRSALMDERMDGRDWTPAGRRTLDRRKTACRRPTCASIRWPGRPSSVGGTLSSSTRSKYSGTVCRSWWTATTVQSRCWSVRRMSNMARSVVASTPCSGSSMK